MDFDPSVVSYNDLLSKFWRFHNPTVTHKPQYMSAIFYHSDEQKDLAEASKEEEEDNFNTPITTKIIPAETFYEAEDYHQKYLLRNQPALFGSLALEGPTLIRSHVAAKLNGYCGGFAPMSQFQAESAAWQLSESQIKFVQQLLDGRPGRR